MVFEGRGSIEPFPDCFKFLDDRVDAVIEPDDVDNEVSRDRSVGLWVPGVKPRREKWTNDEPQIVTLLTLG